MVWENSLMLQPFVLPESVTSFYDYFRLNVGTGPVVEALGYAFTVKHMTLPHSGELLPGATELRQGIDDGLPLLDLTSEMARREYLIAPVLFLLARHVRAKLYSEYALDVTPRLRGSLDYLVLGLNGLLVVEAKQGDLSRGFTQLAAEMIALDNWMDSDTPLIYGAVSIGDVWRFGLLDRQIKSITQDVSLFTVPDNLEALLSILTGILRGAPAT
jgi:hypothetical protein